jgi:hypothetical protein
VSPEGPSKKRRFEAEMREAVATYEAWFQGAIIDPRNQQSFEKLILAVLATEEETMKPILTVLALALSIGAASAQSDQRTTRGTPGLSADGIGQPTGGSGLTPRADDVPLPGSIALQPARGSSGQTHIPGVSENGLPPGASGKSANEER